MYDVVYDDLVDAGVAEKLETPILGDREDMRLVKITRTDMAVNVP